MEESKNKTPHRMSFTFLMVPMAWSVPKVQTVWSEMLKLETLACHMCKIEQIMSQNKDTQFISGQIQVIHIFCHIFPGTILKTMLRLTYRTQSTKKITFWVSLEVSYFDDSVTLN